jgi:predicted permease
MALFRNLGITFRYLSRTASSTVVAIVILTLGLALTIFMFSAINSYILKPLPFPEPEKLIHLEHASPDDESIEVYLHDFLDWRAAQTSFDSLEGFYSGTINLSGQERAERFDGAYMTAKALSELRIQPYLGRLFVEGEDQPGAPGVVILGFDLWRNRYNSDPNIIGKAIRVNAREAVVVGVMPPGFHFPVYEDVWVPMSLDISRTKRGQGTSVEVFGRLRDQVSLAEAQAEFRTISQRIAKEYPDTNKNLTALLKPLAHEYVSKQARTIIFTMFASVVLVLLIACANVANLTVVRMIGRSREFAIRTALGASRWRLVGQVLAECLLISLIAGVFAVVLAEYGSRYTFEALRSNPNMTPPFWVTEGMDWRVAIFSISVAIGAAILAGLLPALRASKTNLNEALHQGGWGMAQPLGRTNRILVIAQIAFSCVLLIVAGLMVRSILNLGKVDVGIRTENILTGRIGLFESKYPDPETQRRFYDSLLQKLATLPDASAASLASGLPGAFSGYNYFSVEQKTFDPNRLPLGWEVIVAPNYFQTFDIPVLEGRNFDSGDHQDSLKVAIVSQNLVEKFWPGESAIGKRLKTGNADEQAEWLTIVGVVKTVLQDEAEEEIFPAIYLPYTQSESRFMSMIVKTKGDPSNSYESLRKAVEELDPDLPVYWIRSLEDWIRINRFDHNFIGTLFGIFAVVAIALAAAGQYSVLAYSVGQRTKEIGVRRALGALDGTILKLFFKQGMTQFFIALAIGLPIAFGFGKLLSDQFFGVSASDPVTMLIVPLTLLAISTIAAIFPARRALHVDPAVALRAE